MDKDSTKKGCACCEGKCECGKDCKCGCRNSDKS